jgi:hypothetical protein
MSSENKCPLQTLAQMHQLCDAHLVKDLTPDQIAALHAFKHEVLAAGFHLYEKISVKNAAPIIWALLKKLEDDE